MANLRHISVACVLVWLGTSLMPCAAQTTTIGNLAQWNGIDGQPSVGEGSFSDATYGQTFIAPAGVGSLASFSLFIDDAMNPEPVEFRAFVMAWDGLKASGPILYQSGFLTTTNNHGAGGFERFNFVINGGLKLTPGATYVAFISASGLFDGVDGEGLVGYVPPNPASYADGGFVSLSNGNVFSALTTNNWDQTFIGLLDLAFELVFAPESDDSAEEPLPVLLVVDTAAISSLMLSSVPTALAQRELALSASRTTLRDFNSRLFRRRAGEFAGVGGGDRASVSHVVMMGEGDGIEPVRGGKGTKVVYDTLTAETRYWEVFTSFDYGGFDIDANRDFLGLQSDTYAASVGIERSLTQHLAIGGGVSYLESDADPGSDVDGVTLAAYVSGVWGGFYADLLYGATLLDHDIDRPTGFGPTAHASPDSVTHSVNLNTGYNVLRGGDWALGPFLGVDYAHAEIDGYTESGGSTAATRVSDQSVDSLITRAGVQLSRRFEKSWGSITPQIRASWERENLGSDDDLTVGLLQSPYYLIQGSTIRSTGAGFSVTVPGQDRESDWMAVGAGVLVRIGPRFHVLLDYEGDFFGGGYTAHFGKVTLGWQF